MSDIEEIKKAVKSDENLRKSFYGIKNAEEAIEIAHANGFNISKKELANNQELSEEMLAAVAGGKGNVTGTTVDNSIDVKVEGDQNTVQVINNANTSTNSQS